MESVLQVKGLSKYFGRKKVVDNIDMEVYAGEVLGFLGPNGAGKTTAIKMIMGFLANDGGSIYINGYNVKTHYEEAMAHVGGIVENPDMYKYFSGMMNLQMYARTHEGIDEARIMETVKLVGLENRINEKVKKYSLGMKQRLGLAQALLHKPRLLILDEPTNGLDPAGIKELRNILTRFAHEENAAVLVSSHQLAEMQLMCDRVAIISEGRILSEKTASELYEDSQELPSFLFTVQDAALAERVVSAQFGIGEDTGEETTENGEVPANAEPGLTEPDEKKLPVRAEKTDDSQTVRIYAERERVPEIIALLAGAGVLIYEIRKEERSLEDAFIRITGGGNTVA